VEFAQGVHDTLEGDASQRPAAEGDVEPFAGGVKRPDVVDGKADAPCLLARERRARLLNLLGVRVNA
jgi:hypothetical protein